MIKILLEGSEASEYVNAKAELDKFKADNLKLMADVARATFIKPTSIKLPELTDLMSAISTGSYISAVKAVRSLTGSTLVDSKNYIESFFDKKDKEPIVLLDDEPEGAPPTKREKCDHEVFYLEDNIHICLACNEEFEPPKDTDVLIK